jgi:hypothetical protein
MTHPHKISSLKLKNVSADDPSQEIESALNTIKDTNIKNGILPRSPSIRVQNFAGKVLKRSKSVYLNDSQYFVKEGTAWEDIDPFHRKHITFNDEDFLAKKGD